MFSSADRQSRLGSAPGGTTLASRAAIHGRRARAEMRLCFVVQRFGPEIAGGAASAALPVAARLPTTVLHPCAHDEPPMYLEIFDPTVRMADGLAMFTEEEAALIAARFRTRLPTAVTGIGIDDAEAGNAVSFRKEIGIGERPYLLYVGRVDPHKGSTELADYFVTYKERNPGPLALVVVGDPVLPMDLHPDIIPAGFVDEATKQGAMAGALAL